MEHQSLLVIDIQFGAFDGVRCPPIDRPDSLIDHAGELITAARRAKVPVIFIQHCEGAGSPFEQGTPHWELHSSLRAQAAEVRLTKSVCNAFTNPELESILKKSDTKSLIICGLQSEYCIRETSIAALALGIKLQLAQDAHRTLPDNGQTALEISERINQELQSLGAILTPTADIVAQLGQ